MKTWQKNQKSLILNPLMSNRRQDQGLKWLFLGFETVSTVQSIHKQSNYSSSQVTDSFTSKMGPSY